MQSCSCKLVIFGADLNLCVTWLHFIKLLILIFFQGNVVPSSTDTLLSLWTNYTVFACRSAPTNASVIEVC